MNLVGPAIETIHYWDVSLQHFMQHQVASPHMLRPLMLEDMPYVTLGAQMDVKSTEAGLLERQQTIVLQSESAGFTNGRRVIGG